MDLMLTGSLVSFFGLVLTWLALPAGAPTAEPTRVSVRRPTPAEA